MDEKKFSVRIASDTNKEKVFAEIYFDGEFVAIISQEQGIENAMIEISLPKNKPKWSFNLKEFLKILKDAQNKI